jgi:hypothetical protein
MKGKGDMKGKGSMNGKGNMTGKGSMTGKYSTQGKDNKPRRQAKAKAVRQQDRSPPPSPAPPYRHWGLDHRRHRQEGNFDRQICLTALFKSKGQSGIMPNPPPPLTSIAFSRGLNHSSLKMPIVVHSARVPQLAN